MFSAPWDFAGVGVRFGFAGPSVVQMTGTLGADDAVTGTSIMAGVTGAPQTGPIGLGAIDLLTRGRVLTSPPSGGVPFDEQVGANFISDLGYPLGALFGRFGGTDPVTDFSFLVQRSTNRTIDWGSAHLFTLQYLEFTAEGAVFHNAMFASRDPAGTSLLWWDFSISPDPVTIPIQSQEADGTLHLANGHTVFTAAPTATAAFPYVVPVGEIALVVDTDNSDGRIGFGVARRFEESTQFAGGAGLFGAYRASILTSGPVGQQFFNAEGVAPGVGSARVVIDLDMLGTYRIYDMAAYDMGGRVALSQGTWDVPGPSRVGSERGNVLQLRNESGNLASFLISFNYALVATSAQSDINSPYEELLGSATTFSGFPGQDWLRGGRVALGDNGHPIFYETDLDRNVDPVTQPWFSQDLVDLWGGEPVISVESSRIRNESPLFMVVGVTAGGDVVVWERSYSARWSYRNITQELGVDRLLSDLTIFPYQANATGLGGGGPGFALAVAGKNAVGDVVIYIPSLEYDTYGRHSWSAVNISQIELVGPTPVWAGPVQGYQTPWGGLNIAGLNSAGEIVVLWTAPAAAHQWFTSNLSQIAGTPALQGALSVMTTAWDAIHITGIDAQGAVHVTWWTPALAGQWVHTDLTADAGGPLLDTGARRFLTFVGAGSTTLNIVGFDDLGRMRVYWWRPESPGWTVGVIVNSFPPEASPQTLAAADRLGGNDADGPYREDGQSIYLYNADGSFGRTWWAPGWTDQWNAENLSEVAIPVMV